MKDLEEVSKKRFEVLHSTAEHSHTLASDATFSKEVSRLDKKATKEEKKLAELEASVKEILAKSGSTKEELERTQNLLEEIKSKHETKERPLSKEEKEEQKHDKKVIKELTKKVASLQSAVIGFEVKETRTMKELEHTMKQLEDGDFKEKELGEEWWVYEVFYGGEMTGDYKEGLVSYNEPHLLKGWEEHKLVKLTPRKIMQLLGTDAGRHIIHPQIWVSSLMSGYKDKGCYGRDLHTTQDNDRWISKFPNWIITDTRFPNELKAVKDRGGITIMIRRKETDHLSGDHASETALDNTEFDHVISNNGTIEDLIKVVKDILQYRGII
jgi:hypothetical protein